MLSLEKAIKLFKDGQYDLSIDYLEQYASEGNVYALENLGVAYQLGFGVLRDLDKAVELLTAAAMKGSGVAAHNLGTVFLDPDILDKVESKYWYRKAKKLGFKVAPDEWYE